MSLEAEINRNTLLVYGCRSDWPNHLNSLCYCDFSCLFSFYLLFNFPTMTKRKTY